MPSEYSMLFYNKKMQYTLRKWTLDDLPSLLKNANNYEIAKYMTNQFPYPYQKEKGIEFLHFAMKTNPTRIFAIDVKGKAIGAIGIHPQLGIQCKNAELGYWIGQSFWGKGIMTKAISEVVTYGFKTFDINRIFARPFGTNIGSQKALEKVGFLLEARFKHTFFKNGDYLDELVYGIRNSS